MTNIIFEGISVLVCMVVSEESCLLVTIRSFLVITVALRLIWNGAILIHGLGHTLAIAAIDKELFFSTDC